MAVVEIPTYPRTTVDSDPCTVPVMAKEHTSTNCVITLKATTSPNLRLAVCPQVPSALITSKLVKITITPGSSAKCLLFTITNTWWIKDSASPKRKKQSRLHLTPKTIVWGFTATRPLIFKSLTNRLTTIHSQASIWDHPKKLKLKLRRREALPLSRRATKLTAKLRSRKHDHQYLDSLSQICIRTLNYL